MARQTKIVGVSFFPETLDAITKAAKSDRRSRSSWITQESRRRKPSPPRERPRRIRIKTFPKIVKNGIVQK